MWKCEVGVLYCVESIQTFSDGFNMGLYSLGETASMKTSSSTSGVSSIGLTVLGSYSAGMEVKSMLNIDYIEINTTLLHKM